MRGFYDFSPFDMFGDSGRSVRHQPALPSNEKPSDEYQQAVVPQQDVFSPFRVQDMFRHVTGQVNTMMKRMDSMAEQMVSLNDSGSSNFVLLL